MKTTPEMEINLRLAKQETGYFRRDYANKAALAARNNETLSSIERKQIIKETGVLIRRGWFEQATSALAELRAWKKEFDWNPNHLSRDFYIKGVEEAKNNGQIPYAELGTSEDEVAGFHRQHHIQHIERTLNRARTWTPEKGRHWLSRKDLLGLMSRELQEVGLTIGEIGSDQDELNQLHKISEIEDRLSMLEFIMSDDYLNSELFQRENPLEERTQAVTEYRGHIKALVTIPDSVQTGDELLVFTRKSLGEKLQRYQYDYKDLTCHAQQEETVKEEYLEAQKRPLCQDINFVVNAIKCRMKLDITVPGPADLWIIIPKGYTDSRVSKADRHFPSQISDALENLWEGATRQEYDFQVNEDCAYLIVWGNPDEWSLAAGIESSYPDWDGDTMDFHGSYRLARLLADWKDSMPEIMFSRGNGDEIRFEERHLRVISPEFEIAALKVAADIYENLANVPEVAIPGIVARRCQRAIFN